MPLSDVPELSGAPPEKTGKIAAIKGVTKSGFSFLERVASWIYLIPLVVIVGIMAYLGIRPVFIAVMLGSCLVWNYWGKRMTMKDPKLVLVVNVEKQEVDPLFCGRKLWQKMEKKGKPGIPFRTPGGLTVEIVRSFDPYNKVIEYPRDADFSDIALAAIPVRYGALIDELVKIREDNYKLDKEGKLTATRDSIERGQEYAAQLNAIFKELINPEDPKKPPEDKKDDSARV